jgi:hypothetical protein
MNKKKTANRITCIWVGGAFAPLNSRSKVPQHAESQLARLAMIHHAQKQARAEM